MKELNFKYFGMIAEHVGKESETVHLDIESSEELLKEVIAGFQLENIPFRMAINRKISTASSTINSGDEIAFLPPFAGG